jgi:hypothetical protein
MSRRPHRGQRPAKIGRLSMAEFMLRGTGPRLAPDDHRRNAGTDDPDRNDAGAKPTECME